MRAMSLALRHELVGLGGVIERNIYLVKRYIWWDIAFFLWTVANTLTIVFIAKGIPAVGGTIDVQRVTTILLFGVVAAFFGLHLPQADYGAALVLLVVASISFIGIGMMTAVLPLISPEKGTQLGFVAQGLLLVVSGVYYPVSVLPGWMQALATISPATYALRGCRAAILEGAGLPELWGDIWPLLVIGAVSVPLGLWVFRTGERYAKKHGKLKRSG